MHDKPRKPSGSSPKVNFDRRNHDEIYQKLRFINTPAVRFDKTTRGLRAKVKIPHRSAVGVSPYFPFRIYVFPAGRRTTPDPDSDWRKFRVRQGVVIGNTPTPVIVSGCDGADYPDTGVVDEGDVADIEVPSGTAEYWFWLEIDEASATATLEHGASPPAAWALTVIPIGKVDTDTFADDNRALIRQYLRTDVIIGCLNFPAE